MGVWETRKKVVRGKTSGAGGVVNEMGGWQKRQMRPQGQKKVRIDSQIDIQTDWKMYIHTPINADRPRSSQFSSRLFFSSFLCLFSSLFYLGGGGTFTIRFDKVAAIGVSELLLLLLVESESDSFWSLRKWLHFTHFFAPRVFVMHFLQNITFAHRTT